MSTQQKVVVCNTFVCSQWPYLPGWNVVMLCTSISRLSVAYRLYKMDAKLEAHINGKT